MGIIGRAGFRAVAVGGAAAAALGVGGAATASAAPVPVYQIPATALVVSGLVIPGPYFASVIADVQPGGVTRFSAPASPSICSTNAISTNISIGYRNLATGAAGSVRVQPCTNFLDPTPREATARTGTGPIVVTITVTGNAGRPGAGQPSLPGVGFYTA